MTVIWMGSIRGGDGDGSVRGGDGDGSVRGGDGDRDGVD